MAARPPRGRSPGRCSPPPAPGRTHPNQFDYGNVKPGTTIVDHLEIVNRSTTSASFSIYATDASGTTPQGSLLLLQSGQKPKDVGAWTSFPGGAQQLSTNIPASKALIEKFTMKVPLLATPGDHTGAMIAAVGVPHRNSSGAMVIQNYRIAVPIEFRVPGALRAGLQVQSISTGFSDPVNPFGSGYGDGLLHDRQHRQRPAGGNADGIRYRPVGPVRGRAPGEAAADPAGRFGPGIRHRLRPVPGRPHDGARRRRQAGLAGAYDRAGRGRAGGQQPGVAVRVPVVSPRPDPAARGDRLRHLVSTGAGAAACAGPSWRPSRRGPAATPSGACSAGGRRLTATATARDDPAPPETGGRSSRSWSETVSRDRSRSRARRG